MKDKIRKNFAPEKSIQTGGALTASQAHEKIRIKRQKEQAEAERKANRAITLAVRAAEKAHHRRGVDARRAERERKAKVKELQAKGQPVPQDLLIPIRDPEKNPTPEELEALKHPSIIQSGIPIPQIPNVSQANIGDNDGDTEVDIIVDRDDDDSVAESDAESCILDDSINADFIRFDY